MKSLSFINRIALALTAAGAGLTASANIQTYSHEKTRMFDDFATTQNWKNLTAIAWGDSLYQFYPNNNGSLGYRTEKITLNDHDVPQFPLSDSAVPHKSFSSGWPKDTTFIAPVLFNDKMYLFAAKGGQTSSDFFTIEKTGASTAANHTRLNDAITQIHFQRLPNGWTTGFGTAFTVGNEMYLLFGNRAAHTDTPSILRFDGVTNAEHLGNLESLGGGTSLRPAFNAQDQRFDAAHMLLTNAEGSSSDVALITYAIDHNKVVLAAFDGEAVTHSKVFTHAELHLPANSKIHRSCVAVGGLRGGPEVTKPVIQLALAVERSDQHPTTFWQTVEYDAASGFALKGSSLSVIKPQSINYFPVSLEYPGMALVSMALPSSDGINFRRTVMTVAPNTTDAFSNSDFYFLYGTQSDLLQLNQSLSIDTEFFTITDELGEETPIPEQLQAGYKGFWSILGVITGAPPYTETTPPGVVSAQIEWSRSESFTSEIKHTSTSSAIGGPAGEADPLFGSFRAITGLDLLGSWSSYNSSSTTLSFSSNLILTPPVTADDQQVGWLVTFQPIVSVNVFHVYPVVS